MKRIVIRPRIQIPLLVVCFAVFGLIGVSYFTNGDVIARHDWFGIVLGTVLIPGAAVGIWRALRLGVVIDADGIRVRGLNHPDRVTPWSEVRAIECAQVDTRAGLPIYGPVIRLGHDDVLAVPALGSYSRSDAERRVTELQARSRGG